MKQYSNLEKAIKDCGQKLLISGKTIQTESWQGISIKGKPYTEMLEKLFVSFQAPMPRNTLTLKNEIKPNLPWADNHFLERIGGEPLNPGEAFKEWPFYGRDKEMRPEDEKFSHTYMERYWPKNANRGIRYEYGDLLDVIGLLGREPHTRQAFLPIWFPEDTGNKNNVRVPCTLGYHFILRESYLHVVYYIRSCDYFRHFRDDIYLTCRLVLWLVDELRRSASLPLIWDDVKPGLFTMHITSLHIFSIETNKLKWNE